jgi:guanylate kinase
MDKQTFITQAQALVSNYRANDQVLAQLSHINLIGIVGPSGAGKSTITRQSGLPFVVGDTTRTMREGEVHGRDYNFRSDFEQLLKEIQSGEFVQFVIQRETDFYGTKASSYPATGACAMSIIATAIPTFKTLGFKTVMPVYIVPPNHTEWMRRLGTHRDKDLEARLLEAKESLVHALNDPSYVFVLNDNLDAAIMTIRKIASGTVDPTASARARSSANTLYEHLQKVIR